MSEHDEQVTLFDRVNTELLGRYPELQSLFAIPNGGDRHPVVAAKLKAEGVKKGVWDLFLAVSIAWKNHPWPGRELVEISYHGLWIEMKLPRKTLELEQSEFGERFWKNGYYCAVCFSCDEAFNTLVKYLSRPEELPPFDLEKYSEKDWRIKPQKKEINESLRTRGKRR